MTQSFVFPLKKNWYNINSLLSVAEREMIQQEHKGCGRLVYFLQPNQRHSSTLCQNLQQQLWQDHKRHTSSKFFTHLKNPPVFITWTINDRTRLRYIFKEYHPGSNNKLAFGCLLEYTYQCLLLLVLFYIPLLTLSNSSATRRVYKIDAKLLQ